MSQGKDALPFGIGTRLKEAPSPALLQGFARELRYADGLYEGLSYADLAHVLMLMETGIVPPPAGRRLLRALVDLHDAGAERMTLDAQWGDLYTNRDAELQRRLGDDAGWLHAGRARREALTLAWLLRLRDASHQVLRAAAAYCDTLAHVAAAHSETLMPDFTYLQHAEPTSLGHYLLGFAYPVWRDANRLLHELDRIDACPAGAASTNGSRLPLDRDRMRAWLGFRTVLTHARDAMWQTDVAINAMAIFVSLATSLDRLAEDLQIWATAEFDYVSLADRHCRTSVIMPQKKNPYALAVIRGSARELAGQLLSVVATNQTPSGQLDIRNSTYELLPNAAANVHHLLVLLAEVVSQAHFNVPRLRRQVDGGWGFATELADILMQREHIDARRAHEVVAAVAGDADGAEVPGDLSERIAAAFERQIGRPLKDLADVMPLLQPRCIVEHRRGCGSCAPEEVRSMATALQLDAAALLQALDARITAAGYPSTLRLRISECLGEAW
jgi:argininosuccinate lyase